MKLLKLAISLLLFVALSYPASAIPVITTNAATGVSAGQVTFNGNAAGTTPPTIVWFEYSSNSNNYIYKTANQTLTGDGAFTFVLTGMPLISGTTFYYRAVGCEAAGCSRGTQVSFTTSALTDIQDYNFDAHFSNLTESELNVTNMSRVGASPYTDKLGAIFWGVLYSLIFAMIWMRQEDITIPALLGLIIGGYLWASMPSDWTSMAMSLTVISFAGLMYSILKGRQ